MDKRLLDEELNESFLEDELFWISREPWIFQANLILDSTMMVDLDDTIYQNKFLIIQGLKKWRRKKQQKFSCEFVFPQKLKFKKNGNF